MGSGGGTFSRSTRKGSAYSGCLVQCVTVVGIFAALVIAIVMLCL